MKHLIDKDALVAEITKRKKRNVLNEGAFEEDIDILSFINTLEVKEVDLEKALSDLDKDIKEFVTTEEFENESATAGHYWAIAKHAFLLSLNCSKVCRCYY